MLYYPENFDHFITKYESKNDIVQYYTTENTDVSLHTSLVPEISYTTKLKTIHLNQDYCCEKNIETNIINNVIDKTSDTVFFEIEKYEKDIVIWSRRVMYKIQELSLMIQYDGGRHMINIILNPHLQYYANVGLPSNIQYNVILCNKIPMCDIYIFGSKSDDIKPLLLAYNDRIGKFNISNENCNTKRLKVFSKVDERYKKLRRILK